MALIIVFSVLVSLLLLCLIIRFLWMVPDDLREIKEYLRRFYNRNND